MALPAVHRGCPAARRAAHAAAALRYIQERRPIGQPKVAALRQAPNVLDGWVHLLQPAPPPPPPAWQRLARAAADGGADALRGALAPAHLPDHVMQDRRQLGRSRELLQLLDPVLAAWLTALFLFVRAGRRALAHQTSARSRQQLGRDAPALLTPPQCPRLGGWDGDAGSSPGSPSAVINGIGSSSSSSGGSSTSGAFAGSSIARSARSAAGASPPHAPVRRQRRAAPPPVALSRHDLHHAHIFLPHVQPPTEKTALGLLFHASEYPARGPSFPHHLGWNQSGSDLQYDPAAMDARNMVWWQDALAVLDVSAHSPLHAALLHEGTAPLRTVYESDFGTPLGEVLWAPAVLDPGCSTSSEGDSSARPPGVLLSL